MQPKFILLVLCAFFLHMNGSFSQTAISSSFETAQGYTAGPLTGQNMWTTTTGTATVSTSKFHTGTQSINLGASGTGLLVNYVPYTANVPGITGTVYADFWVNPGGFTTKGISINGTDLWSSSSKRIFVIEFGTDGTIKAYNGSSAANVGTWAVNTWVRVSLKADFATEKYYVAINGVVSATEFVFREAYTPAAFGTRPAGKEFHSLRFNHVADATVATTDAAFDDVYVGTTAIADISFGASSTTRTITINQPAFGSIAVSPAAPYNLNQSVTATLTVPQGYMNNGWTGDLTGTELVKPFVVTGNLTIGADVGIDANNPPPKYLISVAQPANGSITLSPSSADNMYYKETPVTATVTYEACYQFDGWTGGTLTGTQVSKTFTVQNDVSIGATINLNIAPAVKRSVNTVATLKAALTAMNPGDTVEVADGTYDLSSYTIARSGCSLKPIVITAKNKGGVTLNGATALIFKDMKYVTLKGFVFKSTSIGSGIKLENCNRFRITENEFAYTETTSCTWITIGDTYGSPIPLRSGYNRVDHNSFTGKTQAGNYIRIDGNINQISQYDTIDHNHFKDNGPRADNEKESIRVGVSTLSKSSAFILIEYNLFEDCDGDPEVVSIKSGDNTIRYNTFVRCLGTLCLRQGFRSTVEGNYFFGDNKTAIFNGGTIGCGGVRVYAKDHKIINNYFSGLTGSKWDAAVTITNGDVTNTSTSTADHYLPENLQVAYNTFVNNKSDIEVGFDNNGNYPLKPINITVANNVVLQNTNPIIKSYSTAALAAVNFSNNIMYPTGTGSLGITATAAQINVTDPMLALPNCVAPVNCAASNASKVMRLTAASPAINTGTGSYPAVILDNEQQLRTGANDIGADEYNAAFPVTVGFTALDPINVGPNGVSATYSYTLAGAVPVKLLQFEVRKYNNAARLNWVTANEENLSNYEVDRSTNGIDFKKIGSVHVTGNSNTQTYTFDDPAHNKGKNFYRLKMTDADGRFTYSPVRMINFAVSVNAYPNPVKEILYIQSDAVSDKQMKIRLMAADGRVVKSISTKQLSLTSLSVADISSGIYLLQVSTASGELFTERIVISK
jgi:poly(beta-D-mannuronate) lyase